MGYDGKRVKKVPSRKLSWAPRFRVGVNPDWVPGDTSSIDLNLINALNNRVTRVFAEIGLEGNTRLGFDRPLLPDDLEWAQLHEELLMGDAAIPEIWVGTSNSSGSDVWGQVFEVTGAHGYLPFVLLDSGAPSGSFVMERIVLWVERLGGIGTWGVDKFSGNGE